MALPRSVLFYAVLIAPGFIAVMTAISLAAIEDDISEFVLLVWSLVSSLIIDTVFLWVYQRLYGPLTSFVQMTAVLFTPYFRVDYIIIILVFSVLVGVVYAVGFLADIPGWGRRGIQSKAHIRYNPRQPWENFMQGAKSVLIRTSDDELYFGSVVEWSRAGRPKELRITMPQRYNKTHKKFEPVGGEEQLFLGNNIDRIVVLSYDELPSYWQRWWTNRFWSSKDDKTEEDDEGDENRNGSDT